MKEYTENKRPKPAWLGEHKATMSGGKLLVDGHEVVNYDERNTIIKAMYADPTTHGGRDKLYEHIKERYIGISRRDVMAFLEASETHQTHMPLKGRETTRRIVPSAPDRFAEIDLIDMQTLKGWNGKQSYILTYVDVFSKWAAAEPIPNKKGPTVQAALKKILEYTNISTILSDRARNLANQWRQYSLVWISS